MEADNKQISKTPFHYRSNNWGRLPQMLGRSFVNKHRSVWRVFPFFIICVLFTACDGDKQKKEKDAASAIKSFQLAEEAKKRGDVKNWEKHTFNAAKHGHPKARAILGMLMLQEGIKNDRDEEKRVGIFYLRMAAEGGDADAQYILAMTLSNGFYGEKKNLPEAIRLCRASARSGNKDAKILLEKLVPSENSTDETAEINKSKKEADSPIKEKIVTLLTTIAKRKINDNLALKKIEELMAKTENENQQLVLRMTKVEVLRRISHGYGTKEQGSDKIINEGIPDKIINEATNCLEIYNKILDDANRSRLYFARMSAYVSKLTNTRSKNKQFGTKLTASQKEWVIRATEDIHAILKLKTPDEKIKKDALVLLKMMQAIDKEEKEAKPPKGRTDVVRRTPVITFTAA
ncbi:MAG: hypothetical protein LBS59_05260 [Puniceicoccales bacterium]|jgi:hypothetical protein|nr:hypothetical protein [Puniceicoccales bacterium]